MGYIFEWVKNLVCFYLLITVVLHLLPRKSYQKYVRFFSGILLTILVVSPVLELLGDEEMLRQKISQEEFFQGMDNIKLDTEHLEVTQKEHYLREYERALGMDVSRMAEEKLLVPKKVEVRLTENYEVSTIDMEVALQEEGALVQKASYGEDDAQYPQVYELRQNLMEFYRLEESQIHIAIKREEDG